MRQSGGKPPHSEKRRHNRTPKMKDHFTEADLLETYYMEPGASMPVMMHLANCADCAARYERLDRKLREAAVCHTEKRRSPWIYVAAAVVVTVVILCLVAL